MLYTLLILAQDQPKGGLPPEIPFLFLGAVLVFLFWSTWQGKKRVERERQDMVNGLKKNDKVLTTAGIYGTIVTVSDKEDEVVVKVDDNTRLRMQKGAIARNISGEEAAKAAKEQPKEAK